MQVLFRGKFSSFCYYGLRKVFSESVQKIFFYIMSLFKRNIIKIDIIPIFNVKQWLSHYPHLTVCKQDVSFILTEINDYIKIILFPRFYKYSKSLCSSSKHISWKLGSREVNKVSLHLIPKKYHGVSIK